MLSERITINTPRAIKAQINQGPSASVDLLVCDPETNHKMAIKRMPKPLACHAVAAPTDELHRIVRYRLSNIPPTPDSARYPTFKKKDRMEASKPSTTDTRK
jgi:hypothetical protein